MKLVHAAAVVASSVGMLLLAPWYTGASAHGTHSFHFSDHFRATYHNGRYGAYGAWPFYGGGIVAVPPYGSEGMANYAPPTVVYVPLPPQALTCHRSQQTVTVPSEEGGTRKITVTRC
jgi:hypothetical protein